jgi:RNA polymerase sigma-70 factor (ECF subfamily)
LLLIPMDTIDAETLWQQLKDDLLGFLRRRVESDDVAEDLLQDVFLKVHTGLGDLDDHQRVTPWVYQIARNRVVDHYRSRRQTEELGDIETPEAETVERPEHQILGAWLTMAIDQLPDPYREALRLVEIEGLTQKQAAERLGLSVSGAKSRVQRGRAQLRQMLHRCCQIEQDRRGNVIDLKTRDECC